MTHNARLRHVTLIYLFLVRDGVYVDRDMSEWRCEHSNEASGSVKVRKFTDNLSDFQLLT
jgi:hypothetical protein